MKTVLISLTLLIGLTSCTKDDSEQNQLDCNCTKTYYEWKAVCNPICSQKPVAVKSEKTCDAPGTVQTSNNTYYTVSCQ